MQLCQSLRIYIYRSYNSLKVKGSVYFMLTYSWESMDQSAISSP